MERTERETTGRQGGRRRWGAVAIAAAMLAVSSCTLDFSDGKISTLCYESDYDVRVDPAGDYRYTPTLLALIGGCPQGLLGYYGAPVTEWPIKVPSS